MDFFEVVETRRSIRAFTAKSIEPEKVQAILETANRAPSAGNLQAYEIYVVTRRAALRALADAALGQQFVAQAPVVLVFCANPALSSGKYGRRGISLYSIQDGTIACTHAHLAATALGLASIWVGAFDDDAVRRALGIGKELFPIALLPIGDPAERPDATFRRPLASLAHYIS
jgi:nitroreductase